tara:strand:+ start:722 stop:943 length:222 start_codon:yes stop_codon:yes gene_type:complete
MGLTTVDFVIQYLIHEPVETARATRETPAEYEFFCSTCGSNSEDGHNRGCDMAIVEEFLSKHARAIEAYGGNK